MGGPEIADNPRLRAAVDKALSNNMTKDTIDRAIKRGAGDDDGANMEEITYEGYGKNGVAVLVETMTDNVNRTVSEVRHAFSKFGGNLGTSGSVAFLFTKRGEIFFEPGVEEEKLMEAALEAGAEDVEENEDGSFLVITRPDKSFGEVVDGLKEAGLEPADAEVTMSPSTEAEIDAETAETVGKMIDLLEDLDDVQNVYTNARWPEE
jgi:YebC/PmpR family DNA-binding regulatory protein